MKQRLTELLKWGPLLHTQTFGVLSHSKGHEPVFKTKTWKDHLWKVNVVTLHTINPKEPWNCSFFLFVEQRPNLFNFGSSFTQIPNTEIIYNIILFSVRKVSRLRIHCLLPLKEITKVFLTFAWTFSFERSLQMWNPFWNGN